MQTMKVIAPSTLEEGYTFDVVKGGRTFKVTVPRGGVSRGEEFEVLYPERFVETNDEESNAPPPPGTFKHSLLDCCDVFLKKSLFWMSYCFRPIMEAQLLTRMNLDWCGSYTDNPANTLCVVVAVTVILFILCFAGNVTGTVKWGFIPLTILFIYHLVNACPMRRRKRKKHYEAMERLPSDFVGISDGVDRLEAGKKYLELPYPQHLEPDSEGNDPTAIRANGGQTKFKGLLSLYDAKIVSILNSSVVGYGKGPKRPEDSILSREHSLLCDGIFATHEIRTSLNITHNRFYSYQEGKELTRNNKIDFGLGGGYAKVSLGFQVVKDFEHIDESRAVTGVIDYKYVWATTELRIYGKYLHKYFKDDCCERLNEIKKSLMDNDLLTILTETSHFITTYGTHIILKCSHGYRLQRFMERAITKREHFDNFKAGLQLSAFEYAQLGLSWESNMKEAFSIEKEVDSTSTVGTKANISKSMSGEIPLDKWKDLCAYGGDADVVSHDKTLLISDVVAHNQDWKQVAAVLRYWTYVHIQDLQAGWSGPLDAVSYTIQFKKGIREWRGIYIDLQDDSNKTLDSRFHKYDPDSSSKKNIKEFCLIRPKDPNIPDWRKIGFVSLSASSTRVQKVRVFTFRDESLVDVVEKICIYCRRVKSNERKEGEVCDDTIISEVNSISEYTMIPEVNSSEGEVCEYTIIPEVDSSEFTWTLNAMEPIRMSVDKARDKVTKEVPEAKQSSPRRKPKPCPITKQIA